MAHALASAAPIHTPRTLPWRTALVLLAIVAAVVAAVLLSDLFTVGEAACHRYDSCTVAWLLQFGTP